MQTKELHWYSERLNRDMPLKIYGHAGTPCLVIPSQNGKHGDFESFGMVEACRPWIDSGKLQLFCIDTIDAETWSCSWKPPRERMELHERWIQYLMREVCPLMETCSDGGRLMTMGCSMGAFHAGNLFFRFPDHFDTTICLSGVYDAARITIGSGKGRNWWCVLYPSLCFVDSVHAVVPASSRRTLASQMSEADYHALLPRDAPQHAREDTSQNKKPEIQIKSRLLELISGCGS